MKTLSVLFLLLLCFHLDAQRGVNRYTRENGMISNNLRDVTYDDQGFLWIATDKGIDRFDGSFFIHFQHSPADKKTICNNSVMRIAFDPKGFVWASTRNGGLIRISVSTFNVRNYFHTSAKGSISDNRATAIFIDKDGTTWFSPHYCGLDKYIPSQDKFANYRPTKEMPWLDARTSDLFSDIISDRNNPDLLWCASLNGLFSFNKKTGKWKHFPVAESSFFERVKLTGLEKNMRCLQEDGKGNLYIGTWGGGLLYFDKNQGKYKRYLLQDMEPVSGRRNNIPEIKWRDERYLFVCAGDQNFMIFDTRTKKFIKYVSSEQSIIQPAAIDKRASAIAVASRTDGLFVQDESLIFGRAVNVPFDIRRIAHHPEGNSWLACNYDNRGEIYFRDGTGTGKTWRITEKKNESELSALFVGYRKNNSWFTVFNDRLCSFHPEKGLTELVKFSILNSRVDSKLLVPTAVYLQNDTVLWIGTKYGGLMRYAFNTRKLQLYRKSVARADSGPNHNSWFFAFARYENHIFYGHEDGIGCIDAGTNKFFNPRFAGLVYRKQVRSLAIDEKGIMWIGTETHGIYVIDIHSGKLLRHITEKVGIPLQNTVKLVFDSNNNIWALNASAITVINRSSYRIRSLDQQHGMNAVSDIAFDNNRMYFTYNGGYVTSVSGNPLPPVSDPKPYIQSVRLLDDASYVKGRNRFSYFENNFGFGFGVLDYSNQENNFLTYRLKGLETAWRSGKNKNEAAYYNLPAGKYTFQVRFIEDGKAQITSYSFSIVTAFWLSWWFTLLIFIILAAAIVIFMRSRIRRVKSEERLRSEFNRQINEMEAKALRAQMNPHFLFNSLNSIRLFILKNQVESASDYIIKFSRLLRMILNHSRLDEITVYDEIQTLKLYLEFERLRFDKGFEYDIEIDGQEVLGYYLPPMIIQPFVENAIWHGLMARKDDQGYIRISFSIEPGRLFVTVEDNGIGREQARRNNRKDSLKEGSVGLKITKDRLRTLTRRTNRLNDYEIEDLYDEKSQASGTLIKLYFETEEKT